MENITDRFLTYISYDTKADEKATDTPSSKGQMVFANYLKEELEKLFGFMLFFIGIGMIIGMLIAENVVLVVSAGVFLLLGYHLFCH